MKIYEDNDITSMVGDVSLKEHYQINIKQMSKYSKAILGAVVSGVIVAVLGYLLSVGDIWALNWHAIANIAVMTAAASIIKWLGTSNKTGKFIGTVSVK